MRQGGVPSAEDGRPHGGQGRVGRDPLRVLRRAEADERGPGRGRAVKAAALPWAPPAPGRVRAGRMRQGDPADARRRLQPVVPGHALDHRYAGVLRGTQERPRRPDPHRPGREAGEIPRRPRHPARRAGRQGQRHRPVGCGAGRGRGGSRRATGLRGGTGRAHPHVGPRRPTRPRMALPTKGRARTRGRGPRKRSHPFETGARPRPAAADHPRARGREAAQGQRADRLHPDRRHGPRRGPAAPTRPADPHCPPALDRRHRGPRGGHLPATRRPGSRGVGGAGLHHRHLAGAP